MKLKEETKIALGIVGFIYVVFSVVKTIFFLDQSWKWHIITSLAALIFIGFFGLIVRWIDIYLDKKYPFEKNPVKRIILQFLITLGVLVLIRTVPFVLFYDKLPIHPPREILVATYAINIFMVLSLILSIFGYHFFVKWKQENILAAELEKEKVLVQYDNLKNQLNPHFLFNSLNNLYALTLIKSDLAPQVVLRLSDILRYVLYETSEGKVDLQKELQHLNDFVALEQMRVGDRVKVEIDLEEPAKDYLIEPMLFLTLIENAFKHGAQSSLDEGWVRIQGKSLVEGYCLLVENAKSIEKQPSTHGGIGLDNLKKRLKYIYPDSHELTVVNDESEYRVTLSIKLHYAE